MAALNPAFAVRFVSHCKRLVRVFWRDGVESVFPSTWLRASVRDSRFLDLQGGIMYDVDHNPFVSAENDLKTVKIQKCKRNIPMGAWT